MEKRILIPLDGTDAGEAILSKLDTLVFNSVRHSDVEISLLHVVSIVNYNVMTTDERAQLPYAEDERGEMMRNASSYLFAKAETLRSRGFNVRTIVKVGPAAEEIVQTAREVKASLIAMSTYRRSGILRWAMGSVTDKVIKLAGKTPVLAVNVNEKQNKTSVIPVGSLKSLMGQTSE